MYAKRSTLNISGGTYTNTTFVINNINESGGTPVTVSGAANTAYTGSGATVTLIQ